MYKIPKVFLYYMWCTTTDMAWEKNLKVCNFYFYFFIFELYFYVRPICSVIRYMYCCTCSFKLHVRLIVHA